MKRSRWIQRVFEGHIPGLLSWIIQFYFGKQMGGSDEAMVANKGADLNSGQVYIMRAIGGLKKSTKKGHGFYGLGGAGDD